MKPKIMGWLLGVMLAVGLAAPAVSQAATLVYWPPGGDDNSGVFMYAGREEFGPNHSIWKNSARSLGAQQGTVCIEVYELNGTPLQNRCSSTLAYRDDLCGCKVRSPSARTPGSGIGAVVRAREDW